MKALRIAICDDETKILDEVSYHIKKHSEKSRKSELEVMTFNSASLLLNSIDNGALFDIFILDVYIGEEMGTTLAKEIRAREIENPIIFLTTSIEHAPQGYETGTLRYLIKPLEPEKFYEAIDVALLQAEKLQSKLIRLKTENGIESINANNIMYSEAHDHYQYITLENTQLLKVRMTVSELYAILAKNDGFFRLGSAYIINLRNIKNLTSSEILLYNNKTIPIPRGKHAELKKVFWNFQCE
ncbi:MAG: response regulator transcription factor [Ruminococcaceae bacterium]|nr:response regulator transcription factor [Oscillospiraceae bacterium]